MIRPKIIGSVAELPDHGYGPRTIMWWGVLAFMMMEASAFLLAIFAYFFISGQYDTMPPGGFHPPDHLWGAVFTVVALLSLIPNFWAEHAARKQDQRPNDRAVGGGVPAHVEAGELGEPYRDQRHHE